MAEVYPYLLLILGEGLKWSTLNRTTAILDLSADECSSRPSFSSDSSSDSTICANMKFIASLCLALVLAGAHSKIVPADEPRGKAHARKPPAPVVDIGAWIQAHPFEMTLLSMGLPLAGGAFVVAPVLGALGFGAAGVGAGSAAAGIQSAIGPIVAGSPFAWATSVGAGGAALGGLQVAGGAGLGLSGVGAAVAAIRDNDVGRWLGTARRDVERELSKVGPAVQEVGKHLEKLWTKTGPAMQGVVKHAERGWVKVGPAVEGAARDAGEHLKRAG